MKKLSLMMAAVTFLFIFTSAVASAEEEICVKIFVENFYAERAKGAKVSPLEENTQFLFRDMREWLEKNSDFVVVSHSLTVSSDGNFTSDKEANVLILSILYRQNKRMSKQPSKSGR